MHKTVEWPYLCKPVITRVQQRKYLVSKSLRGKDANAFVVVDKLL